VSATAGIRLGDAHLDRASSDGGASDPPVMSSSRREDCSKRWRRDQGHVTGLTNGTAYSFTLRRSTPSAPARVSGAFKSVIPAKATSKSPSSCLRRKVTYGHEQSNTLSGDCPLPRNPPDAGPGMGDGQSGSTPDAFCVIKLSSGKGSCTPVGQEAQAGTYRLVANLRGSKNFKGSTSTERKPSPIAK